MPLKSLNCKAKMVTSEDKYLTDDFLQLLQVQQRLSWQQRNNETASIVTLLNMKDEVRRIDPITYT